MLAQQIEQRRFKRGDRVNRGAQIDWPTTNARASSSVLRIASPPGTSPMPVLPALSRSSTTLRVKNGPCAPERFISMLSRPATGTTRSSVTTGVAFGWTFCVVMKALPV
jgi:hypothetical protein